MGIRAPLVQDGIEVVKLASRTLVYLHVPSKTPLFFDVDGRNKLFPTVYALWRVRQISAESGTMVAAAKTSAQSGPCSLCCPTLVVHPPVSKFVLNGADVMLPGTRTCSWNRKSSVSERLRKIRFCVHRKYVVQCQAK